MISRTSYTSLLLVLFTSLAALLYRATIDTTIQILSSSLGFKKTSDAYRQDEALSWKVKILSYDPFIAHISDFIPPSERNHLKELAAPLLSRSTLRHANGTRYESKMRTSSTAYLPYSDPIVHNIFQRAAEFQGFLPIENLDMQVTSYSPGQRYMPHYDWSTEPGRTRNRLSTFFAILEADCEDCGTQFPRIRVDWTQRDGQWCEIVDCGRDVLTTRNVVGSALFWRNLDGYGNGRNDTLHAGLPAHNGSKVGLNIWTDIDLKTFEMSREASVLRP